MFALNSQPTRIALTSLLAMSALCTSPVFATALVPPGGDDTTPPVEQSSPLNTDFRFSGAKTTPTYVKDFARSQLPRPIGSQPVQPVVKIRATVTNSDESALNDRPVALNRPPLQALISVQQDLNPFSLDAQAIEKVSLQDCVRVAETQNLDIANSFDNEKSSKYAFLASATKFLPDLNGGYSLYGVNGTIPGALFGAGSNGIKLPSMFQLLSAGFTYNAYQGGAVMFGMLQQRHNLHAARFALKGTTNDVYLEAARRYYDLLLNEALLDIRNRAVEISKEQVRLNSSLEGAGAATGLDVLQSQAQLASDEQNLVDQQQARRQSSIQLSHVLNSSFAQDLASVENDLRRARLVAREVPVAKLLTVAVDNRPELKQYEELRLAAKRAIIVAQAPLHPTVSLGGTVYGVQASADSMTSLFLLNFSVNWKLGHLGTTDLANIQQARWQARQATVQATQIFQQVFEQVRTSYDQSLAADKRIEHASTQIAAAEEELRIAKKRMEAGVGLNIDVLNAQRDLTQASINKARAIIDFNIAQAQLLHDTGLISSRTLTQGANID